MTRELLKSLGVTIGTVAAIAAFGNIKQPTNQETYDCLTYITTLTDTNHDGTPDTATTIYPSLIYGTGFITRQPTKEEVREYQIRKGIPVVI